MSTSAQGRDLCPVDGKLRSASLPWPVNNQNGYHTLPFSCAKAISVLRANPSDCVCPCRRKRKKITSNYSATHGPKSTRCLCVCAWKSPIVWPTVLACCLMHGLRKKSKKDNSRIALMFSKKIYTKQSMQKLAAAKATTRTFCRHSMLHLLPCSTSTTSDDGCESA